jgi:hypothetical protein
LRAKIPRGGVDTIEDLHRAESLLDAPVGAEAAMAICERI